jgi:hypothetical protein
MQKLIAMGAVDIIVPGVMPFGCFALYLTELKSSNKSDYDDYGCLKPLNELAIHHNSLLQISLAAVQARHRRSPSSSPSSPSPAAAVRIMYADYYAVVAEMMQAPARAAGVQERHRGVLRRGGRRVQLGVRGAVRHEGRRRVRQPVERRVLGRRAHDGGGEPGHRRRLAQGTLLPPAHSALDRIIE